MAHCFLKKVGGSSSSSQNLSVIGLVEFSTTSTTKVTLGFKPKKLMLLSDTSGLVCQVYDDSYSTTKFIVATNAAYSTATDLGGSTAYRLKSIDSDGFTVTKGNNAGIIHYYMAIG